MRAIFCAHIHIAVIRTEASVDANLLTSIASCMPKDESLLLFLWWFVLRDGLLFLGPRSEHIPHAIPYIYWTTTHDEGTQRWS